MRKSLKYLQKQRSCQKPEPGRRYHVGMRWALFRSLVRLRELRRRSHWDHLWQCPALAWSSLEVHGLRTAPPATSRSATELQRSQPDQTHQGAVEGLPLQTALWMRYHPSRVRTGVWCGGGVCLVVLDGRGHGMRCSHSRLCCVQIGFFLELPNVLLVPDSLIAKPVGHLQWREVRRVKDTQRLTSSRYHVCCSECACHSPQPVSAGYSRNPQ